MKVRFGVGVGPVRGRDGLARLVDRSEELGIDSLWFSELVYSPLVDPVVGLAFAVSRTSRLKVGTSVSILPGRHPALVAKQLASLASVAPGRILPVFGLRSARAAERELFPVPRGRRAAVFDEALVLVRLLLEQPRVTFAGEFYSVSDASVGVIPDKPLDLWLGASTPAGLRRVGRLGDGWLASLVTPDEAASAITLVEQSADEAGRQIDPEHYGVTVPVAFDEPPDGVLRNISERRPDVDPATFVPHGWDGARRLVEQFIAAGVSKFVVRPAVPPASWDGFLSELRAELVPLQT